LGARKALSSSNSQSKSSFHFDQKSWRTKIAIPSFVSTQYIDLIFLISVSLLLSFQHNLNQHCNQEWNWRMIEKMKTMYRVFHPSVRISSPLSDRWTNMAWKSETTRANIPLRI
jgi:hypothetical protein